MRLVWAVIPLVLIGIVGVQESFAEERTRVLPEEILNALDLCEDTYGKWISDHNECETTGYGNTTEAFESYCKEFNGDYTYCHSGCRNVEGFDEGKMVCAAQCVQVCEFSVPTAKIFSPKKQIRMGISSEDITCKEGKQLIFKSSNNSPVCVKPATAEKLIERGWAIGENKQSTINSEYENIPDKTSWANTFWIFDYDFPIESFPTEILNQKLNEKNTFFQKPSHVRSINSIYDGISFSIIEQSEEGRYGIITDQTYEISIMVYSNEIDTQQSLEEILGVSNVRYFVSVVP